MSPSIPEPARPSPRSTRNTFQQAATTMRPDTAEEPATSGPAPSPQKVGRRRELSEPERAAPATKRKRITRVPTTDVLLTLPEELKERMVNVQAHTQARTGITSQQAFIRYAISQLCARLEEQHNGGALFDPVPDPIDT